MVEALSPVVSVIRLAARPVGSAKAIGNGFSEVAYLVGSSER